MTDSQAPPTGNHRTTITFVPPGLAAVARMMLRKRMNRNGAVNRAVQVCDFIDQEMEAGNEVVIRTPDGSVKTVHLL